MAISGTDWLEVPTIYKAYFSGLCIRGYTPNFYGLQYGTSTNVPPSCWILFYSHWIHRGMPRRGTPRRASDVSKKQLRIPCEEFFSHIVITSWVIMVYSYMIYINDYMIYLGSYIYIYHILMITWSYLTSPEFPHGDDPPMVGCLVMVGWPTLW